MMCDVWDVVRSTFSIAATSLRWCGNSIPTPSSTAQPIPQSTRRKAIVNAAFDLNSTAQLLAGVAADQAVPFIHMSTDYVFDGTKPAPYDPADPVCPINMTAVSKAAGEAAVRAANPSAVIIRTSWVYSETGVNFVKRMLELGAERDELRIVDDQIGNPTFADDIAQAIASHDDMRQGATGGIYHAAGRGDVTWHGFARAILPTKRENVERASRTHVIPITTDQYPTQARRPKNSRLDCTSAEATFAFILKPWQNGLKTCINRLLAGGKP